jgi:hypothetical protein
VVVQVVVVQQLQHLQVLLEQQELPTQVVVEVVVVQLVDQVQQVDQA